MTTYAAAGLLLEPGGRPGTEDPIHLEQTMNHTDPTADFDGCRRVCRQQGVHTLVRGECERAPEPEPTVSLSRPYTAPDGFPGIVFDRYTVLELAGLIEPALRRVAVRLGPNALGMLERGEPVRLSGGEYADLAREAAHAIVHRTDAVRAAAAVAPADQTELAQPRRRKLRHRHVQPCNCEHPDCPDCQRRAGERERAAYYEAHKDDPDEWGDAAPAAGQTCHCGQASTLGVMQTRDGHVHIGPQLTPTPADRAAEPVCICGHPQERHFEDVCQTCGCGDYLEPRDAAEVIARWRQAALKARADRSAILRELADQQEQTAVTDVIRKRRSIATARRLFAVELRRLAAEAQQQGEGEAPTAADTQQMLTRMRANAATHALDHLLGLISRWAASSEGRDVLLEDLVAGGYRLPHACGNCEGIDPDTCLKNPNRSAPVAQQPAAADTGEEA